MKRMTGTVKATGFRLEHDGLGELAVPVDAYYGIHTLRAVRNFPFSGYRLHPAFIRAFAQVKLACAKTNMLLGYLPEEYGWAICDACTEIASGKLHDQIVVDPFQGGAGTSTNMNLNEVIASRAAELLGARRGDTSRVHPILHVNMHQSTNDVYPTALRVAVLFLLTDLETSVASLQEAFQGKEAEFRDVVKAGRTELTDAVPMTMGMSFGAFADAVARDRWRLFKCRERLKKVNLGGTAIGTGLGAPRDYVLSVAGSLAAITGLPLSRAENLVDATQNMDTFVEVSGMLKACAATLMKIASDLRLLSSGPKTGLGELTLPPLQTGSSIMAGKINPVMPEAVTQAALRIMANDQTISLAAAMGQLELNHLLPLLAHSLLESLTLLVNSCRGLAKCTDGIQADREQCRAHVERSGALATVLVPLLGYDRVERLMADAQASGRTVRDEAVLCGVASVEALDRLLSPKRLCKLGYTPEEFEEVRIP
ncbi:MULTISPECIES: aspartate ammonia-lyase [unclassified Pseudodesulfovibrio]|uniref:aspartate ammonia-lyase n=1 Tax=unclassified Pseudodesulfovibrio TaxID=2661612 RepID=UPI000FEB6356|nr:MULTISPECIES: aspartate ammonia-lyase [unclassified Pseudodesulfovibrio]MCJ2164377.1 aspartate ammonia-lyase [Pseudodesulfovibrio sp. S3-i]RWU04585.1 aspartate ammonia-lyase [Pseudodesulfovibrio sp. S3]